MTTKGNGGPAFPASGVFSAMHDGMNLRDYFAAKAMQALISIEACSRQTNSALALASASYDMADAMLAERAK